MALMNALSGAMQGSSAGPFGAILGAVLGARAGNKQEDTAEQPQLTMDSSDMTNATNYAKITDLGRDYD